MVELSINQLMRPWAIALAATRWLLENFILLYLLSLSTVVSKLDAIMMEQKLNRVISTICILDFLIWKIFFVSLEVELGQNIWK